MLGSHRDAWTFGALDPISGHSSVMEIARVFGELLSQGWKPRRTIVICSWDAEEYGLIGSFEFTERWAKQLFSTSILYLNLDVAVTGADLLSIKGTPALQKRISSLSKSLTVRISTTNSTNLYNIWNPPQIDLLGSGSDFTSFIQRLGVPSLDMEMSSREDKYQSVYHSNYDSFYWAEHFADPNFFYHAAMVGLCGAIALDVADAEVLPFDYTDYYSLITNLIGQLKTAAPTLNFTYMDEAVLHFHSASLGVNVLVNASGKTDLELRALNDRLMMTERAFLGDPMITGSKYFLHVISTPSDDNMYAANAFPAIYSAINAGDLKMAQFVMDRIAQVIDGAADFLSYSFMI